MAPHGVACAKPIGFTGREGAGVWALGTRGIVESAEKARARGVGTGCGGGLVHAARALG